MTRTAFCLDADGERAAVSLLKPAFITPHVTGILAQAALGHYCHRVTWAVCGEAQNDSIKTPECKHQQRYNWERFHRYICEAGDREEELSNIRKKLYRSPHKRWAIYSPKTWGTNKITWQLHQLIPHLPSLVHQRARFHNDFPCPHLHFHPPFYFLDKLPLLDVHSNSSSPDVLPEGPAIPTLPPSWKGCRRAPSWALLRAARASSRRPSLLHADPASGNVSGTLLGGLLPIFCHLLERDL